MRLPVLVFVLLELIPIAHGEGEPFPESARELRLSFSSKFEFHPIVEGPLTDQQFEILLDAVFYRSAEFALDPKEIAELCNNLAADKFAVREAATRSLASIGTPALLQLRALLGDNDIGPEMHTRAKTLIQNIEAEAELQKAKDDTYLVLGVGFLLAQMPDAHLPDLVDGILKRTDRRSDDGFHATMIIPIIQHLLRTTPEEVTRLTPLLNKEDLPLAQSVLVQLMGEPSHPLFLAALNHPADEIVSIALESLILFEIDDPNWRKLHGSLLPSLKRNIPLEGRLYAAETLISFFQEPAAIDFLHHVVNETNRKQVAIAIDSITLSGGEYSKAVVDGIAKFLNSPHEELREASAIFLLHRTRREDVRKGIENLHHVSEERMKQIRREEFHSPKLLLEELSRSLANDTGEGPMPASVPLLEMLQPFDHFELRSFKLRSSFDYSNPLLSR